MTDAQLRRRWRILAWGGAAALLAVPAVAMLFTDEVRWTLSDFVVMGALLFGCAALFDVFLRRSGQLAYHLGGALAVAAMLVLVWINLAVGIIGAENDPRNLLFVCVIATAAGGAIGGGFSAAGMARTMLATAVVQALIAVAVLTGSAITEGPAFVRAFLIFSGFLVAVWLAAAALFRRAARAAMATG